VSDRPSPRTRGSVPTVRDINPLTTPPEQEAEHRQLEGEALVEAQRDRDMFERDALDDRNPKK